MKLDGVHHITAITANAQQNVDFYAGTLGLRMVKKTVNQDQPSVYHLFYADEKGTPGADMTFFEFPDAAQGRPGQGMVHRIIWRVASEAALDFWAERLTAAGSDPSRNGDILRFSDPEGLEHEFVVSTVDDQPLIADHPEVPAEHALQGFEGARAFTANVEHSRSLLEEHLGFEPGADGWEIRGRRRGGTWAYDAAPDERGIQGAGTVHHIAWASETAEHEGWRERAIEGGAHPTPVIDRFWFESIYFREPSGVLFEIATMDPGFGVDEDPEHLGEKLILPPFLEDKRAEIERVLTPVENPRAARSHG
ncbi:MAG: glyoxalase family protein [Solirubrobacterales bacterium]|jgi:glyoxalase family protein|nr:glyoxalase family protein [Solirubrobacterales bacterium]